MGKYTQTKRTAKGELARELCKVSEIAHKRWDEVKILRITGESDLR